MSVMDELTNVVSAARNLLDTVSGKMQQIDSKVDAATKAVPNTIRSLSEQTFYIDAEYGDDNNNGSQNNPFKTASAAQSQAVPSATTILYFKGGQDHIVKFNSRCSVRVHGWQTQSHGLGKPRLHPGGNDHNGDSSLKRLRAFVGVLDIAFNGVDIACDEYGYDPDGNKQIVGFYSAFVTGNGSKQIFLNNVDLDLTSIPLTDNWSGNSSRDISMTDVEINSQGGELQKVLQDKNAATSTLRIAVHGVTLSGGATWQDLIPINADQSNILTNINL